MDRATELILCSIIQAMPDKKPLLVTLQIGMEQCEKEGDDVAATKIQSFIGIVEAYLR